MNEIVLTKEQINNLFIVYDQFKLFDDFTVTLCPDGTVSVKFEMNRVKGHNKKFIQETFR